MDCQTLLSLPEDDDDRQLLINRRCLEFIKRFVKCSYFLRAVIVHVNIIGKYRMSDR